MAANHPSDLQQHLGIYFITFVETGYLYSNNYNSYTVTETWLLVSQVHFLQNTVESLWATIPVTGHLFSATTVIFLQQIQWNYSEFQIADVGLTQFKNRLKYSAGCI